MGGMERERPEAWELTEREVSFRTTGSIGPGASVRAHESRQPWEATTQSEICAVHLRTAENRESVQLFRSHHIKLIKPWIWRALVCLCVCVCVYIYIYIYIGVVENWKNCNIEDKPLLFFLKSKNEDTFAHVIYMLSFFSTFLLCHSIGHSPICICQLPICIYILGVAWYTDVTVR